LIENSIKYTPDGGIITLSADVDADYVGIRVTDNGRGIPKDDLPILFDKFYRGDPTPHSAKLNDDFFDEADAAGVGLGLYLARDVMERMGGKISVKTEVGEGSTFALHVPIWKRDSCGKLANEVKVNAEPIARG
jgi:signal transduction histidine kinase